MIRLSVCVDMLLEEGSFTEKVKRVADTGVNAVEFWTWWDKDLNEVGDACSDHNVDIAAFCTKFESLVDPGRHQAYIDGLAESIEAAKTVGCKTLISTTGNELQDVSRQVQHENVVAGLKLAAPLLESAGLTLVLEPLNVLVDHKGYYLYSSKEAFDIVDEVASPSIKVLYDVYHQQVTEGNLIANIAQDITKIGHFHAADVPGRHEPGTGEINYRNVLVRISDLNYGGYVGLEYSPTANFEASLQELSSIIEAVNTRQ